MSFKVVLFSLPSSPLSNSRYSDFDPIDDPTDDLRFPPRLSWREEEQASLRRSLRSLQTQLASERAQREASEREADMLASENSALGQQLQMMEGCQVWVQNVFPVVMGMCAF